MASFYKLTLRGRAFTQTIINIFYYSDATVPEVAFDAPTMTELATQFLTDVASRLVACVTTAYTTEQVDVTIVNERNVTLSPFAVSVAATIPGTRTGDSSTAGMSAILSFRVLPALPPAGSTLPKRSYIALGPISDADMAGDGRIQLPAAARASLEQAATLPLETTAQLFVPYRVGRSAGTGPPSYGTVAQAVFRDFGTFRRSRLVRPSGN